jgi:acetoin utilization deacetylase AcuC-like enzyme
MTLLYTSPRFLEHDTGRHPENASRLVHITRHFDETGLAARCTAPTWSPATIEQLTRVHQSSYIAEIADTIRRGGQPADPDTVVSSQSFDVARLATGAAIDAVGRVIRGEDATALCLIRPPGHHARPHTAMGFCLFNNVAVAAQAALDEHGLDRVLVVDWDVHHGNGTQEMFWRDERVGFFSIHRFPFYPGSGNWDETGSGPGLGTTVNVPVEFGTPRRQYFAEFTAALTKFADHIRPQLVLISAGFDSHRTDPVGSLGLETEDFTELTTAVRDVARTHASSRIVSLLEGGYNPPVLAESVGVHLQELLRSEI